MERELGFGHLGNGISVWDRLHEEHGDYQKVAHIDSDRKITYYKTLDNKYIRQIEQFAANADPRCSVTQNCKVFRNRPEGKEGYVVVEGAGTDDERIVYSDPRVSAAYRFKEQNYSSVEIDELQVDVMLQREGGELTAEF